MSAEPVSIRYVFTLADGQRREFGFQLDPESLEMLGQEEGSAPFWTELHFQQCENCPLDPAQSPRCPVALRLAPIVEPLDSLVSFDRIELEVQAEDRRSSWVTSAQQAISSLLGLVMVASGCPRTRFLRPMARFHLPLASEAETTYRAAAMYMLAQYFVSRAGGEPDLELAGLEQRYAQLHGVNAGIVKRLRSASQRDSALNAVVLLDLYTVLLPDAIAESLAELRPLFRDYLPEDEPASH